MQIQNQTKQTTIATQCRIADTFFSRLKGLLGSPPLVAGEGLLLVNEKSIHTFFMGFPIDVVYINHDKTVIRLERNVTANQVRPFVPQSAYILELPIGIIDTSHTQINDQLVFD
ncbi:MAG: DUF192 domain-containing protein [Saprospiraceae bacterium]